MGVISGVPCEDDAIAIATEFFGESVLSCERFATGLRHWVYDVTLRDSLRSVVVRLSHPDHRAELAGGIYWHDRLASVGVPVARVLGSNTTADQPYMILERLDGTDIDNVLDELTSNQVSGAARSVAVMQRNAATMPRASGYGYALSYDTPLRASWRDVLQAHLERSREWVEAAGVVDTKWIDRTASELRRCSVLLSGVTPTAFLHDATTKNVIINAESVTGLVDVDEMAFGDPLWTVALTRMSLLSSERPTAYADEQIALIDSTTQARDRVDLYTALHCAAFLGEIGQTFNRTEPARVDHDYRQHLETLLSTLIQVA